jgi:hypothetical protein
LATVRATIPQGSKPALRAVFPVMSILLLACASSRVIASEVTIGNPANGARVTSPVLLRAFTTGCHGLAPTKFGYTVDESTKVVEGESAHDIDVMRLALAEGEHTIHFRTWTSEGECSEETSKFTVASAKDPSAQPSIPSNAVSSGDMDGSADWQEEHDGGTPGKSKGSTTYPAKTPLYTDSREFYMTYTDQAGERWSTKVARDANATHFVLDLYVLLPSPSEAKNVEMDIDQVVASGETVILSTQCSGEIGRWEFGDSVGRHDHWKSTPIKCDPADWSANTWHHIQIGEHHAVNSDIVTHDWITIDGVYTPLEDATLESGHFLDWGPGDTNTQFQIEGASTKSGSVTAYVHKLTIYRW